MELSDCHQKISIPSISITDPMCLCALDELSLPRPYITHATMGKDPGGFSVFLVTKDQEDVEIRISERMEIPI